MVFRNTQRKNTGRGPCTPLSSRQHYFLNPRDKGLLYCSVPSPASQAKVFAEKRYIIEHRVDKAARLASWRKMTQPGEFCCDGSFGGSPVRAHFPRNETLDSLSTLSSLVLNLTSRVKWRTEGRRQWWMVFRHTVHDWKLSLVYLYRVYSVLVILPRLNCTQVDTWLRAPSPRIGCIL